MSQDDLKLQVLEWGGHFFIELKLIFGGVSSPGIYDELAKVFLWCVMLLSRMPRYAVEQHLDDVIAVGLPGEDSPVFTFFRMYQEEARKCGIRLDASGNVEKCQSPATTFVGLGVCFDTVRWVWWLKQDKLARILIALNDIRSGVPTLTRDMATITGKLVDIRDLVPGGRYNLLYFLRATHDEGRNKFEVYTPSNYLRQQADWWIQHINVAHIRSPIILPDPQIASNALESFTDAAGGSRTTMGAGIGAILPPHAWAYVPWPHWLNMGGTNSQGIKFDSKLSCLELLGPLLVLTCMPDYCKGQSVIVWCDNLGSVDIYKKGHSTKCPYSSCIAKACFDLSQAMGAVLTVQKIRRCSNSGSVCADAASKGDFRLVAEMMPDRELSPRDVNPILISWIKDPVEDLSLGDKLARSMGF